MSVIIFSRPIHSGKTSELMEWSSRQKNIHGILMPDINGYRKIYNIATKDIFDIECPDTVDCKEPLTTIGRFNFYTSAFNRANHIIKESLEENPDWLVIDEAGRLEIDGKGFHSGITLASEKYNKWDGGNLLITVRESLCTEVITFFKFRNYNIIHQLAELDGL